MADDVLSQLGVNLPPLPSGNEGVTQTGATAPVTEGMEAPKMESIKEIAFMAGAGCITAIEQIMLPVFGTTSEEGKKLIKCINLLESIVPPEKLKEAQGNIANMLGQAGVMPQATPTQQAQTAPVGAGAYR